MLMREIRNLKKWVEDYEVVRQKQEDLTVLLEFQKAGEITDAEVEDHYRQTLRLLEDIEFRNMLPILEIIFTFTPTSTKLPIFRSCELLLTRPILNSGSHCCPTARMF